MKEISTDVESEIISFNRHIDVQINLIFNYMKPFKKQYSLSMSQYYNQAKHLILQSLTQDAKNVYEQN